MEYVQAADDGALVWLGNHHQPWLNAVMKAFTFLGDKWTMLALVALAATLFFLLWGRRRTAFIVLLGALLAVGISQGCKYVLKRPRPDVAWRLVEPERTPSLPSGHSLLSMAILGGLALTLSRTLPRRGPRWSVIALGLGLPLLVGISRPYLGVHYPSDVLAGWTVGLACALLTFWADRRWGESSVAAPPVPEPETPAPRRPRSPATKASFLRNL
jgi:undecaprenyl-diphosphatase